MPLAECVHQTVGEVCGQRSSCDEGSPMLGTLHQWAIVTAAVSVSTTWINT